MGSPVLVILLTATLAIASARVAPRGHHGLGIVGGVPANITDLPHQVYLRSKSGSLLCGGSIISKFHILTSGTCAKLYEANQLEVVLGADNRTAGDGIVFQVAKATVHENYTLNYLPFAVTNDVAVLKLVSQITFSDKARNISLAGAQYEVKNGTELIVSGWGWTSKGRGNFSDILRQVSETKVSLDECRQAWIKIEVKVSENELCAGGDGGKGVFKGDAGSALIERTTNGTLQVGIASWAFPQDKPGFPDVYVKVSKYYDWINNVVKRDLESEN